MAVGQKRVLFFLFFVSGFCGLLYQVVWMRMALASFGVITPVMSVVISVFMLGLFVGSWGAGKIVGKLSEKTGLSAIWFYAAAELLVGVGAFAVPRLFSMGETMLLPSGETDSLGYLLRSGLIIGGALFPWCVFMGTTFPFVMAFVKERDSSESTSFSFLYLANVIGAMLGTLVTAVVLVELLGFNNTLLVAAAANVVIALTAAGLGVRYPYAGRTASFETKGAAPAPSHIAMAPAKARLTALILFTTGFTSMAMEVVWTRAFTVVLQTQVYSFAALLFVYLLATWIGSLKYRKHLASGEVVPTARLIALLAITAFLPIVLNDPRLQLRAVGALFSIFPFCALLGYLTPKLIDQYSAGNPDSAGYAYALNILGCIVGPLFASYGLLPLVGLKYSLLILAVPYLLLFLIYAPSPALGSSRKQAYALVALLFLTVLVNKTYEDRMKGYSGDGVVRRDHTATVISFGSGIYKRLLVNGIGITHMTTITKVMAHLPLALTTSPKSALVICFGMGTTFRALMSWNIKATAVELVPSVKEAFPYYFDDAEEIMKRPNGKIVVDDGRRFLRRTTEMFDVITLDPPPPVEAAGSSLLYSEEFYTAVKSRLAPGGILQQWIPAAEDKTVQAVVKSLMNSFPYVRMYGSFEGWGHHFLASMSPIVVPSAEVLASRMPETAKRDLLEWTDMKDARHFMDLVIGQEIDPRTVVKGIDTRVTDDRPYNEYYLIRRTAKKLGLASTANG